MSELIESDIAKNGLSQTREPANAEGAKSGSRFSSLFDWIISKGSPHHATLPYLLVTTTAVTIGLAIFGDYSWKWWLLSYFVVFLTSCLGMEVTYHRFLTHRSFHMPKWMEYLFSTFGAMGGSGSALTWVAMHRQHHDYTDAPKDPHSPNVFGWLILLSRYQFTLRRKDFRGLIRDRFHVTFHKFYYFILLGWAALLYAISVDLFLFAYVVPVALHLNILTFTNFFGHTYGYRNFDTRDKSVNNPLMAAFNWGDGWHNNHHHAPGKWNFSEHWWEFDLSAWVIRAIRLTARKAQTPN